MTPTCATRHLITTLLLGTVALFIETSEAVEVVYKSRHTISAVPFYRGIKVKSSTKRAPMKTVPNENPHTLVNRLPIVSELLQPGAPRIVESPQQKPAFAIGGDRSSRDWLIEQAPALAELGATGVVVSLASMTQWKALETIAQRHGLPLYVVNGDAIAEAYGIATYPVVIVEEGSRGH